MKRVEAGCQFRFPGIPVDDCAQQTHQEIQIRRDAEFVFQQVDNQQALPEVIVLPKTVVQHLQHMRLSAAAHAHDQALVFVRAAGAVAGQFLQAIH